MRISLSIFLLFFPVALALTPPVFPSFTNPTLPPVTVTTQDLKCLADNIYHEARSEGFIGMLAVANVTLNRVTTEGFPDTVCAVVYQPNQFSWTNLHRQIHEYSAYQQAMAIARYAIETTEDITNGALFFHTTNLRRPRWSQGLEEKIIGNHIFYKEK